MKKAYSYIRFSTEIQLKGDSLRRQLESSKRYCKEKNLDLQELDFKDLGVSGWKGKNSQKGALGDFLKACEEGKIEAGSALIVESLDRISRQSPRKTIALLNSILDFGIELHLTLDNKIFYPNDDKNQGIDLIIAVTMAMRANEESSKKSERLLDAHRAKRIRAEQKKDLVATSVPWFLKIEDGKIIAPIERVKIVRRIFKSYLKGKSCVQIARELTNEKIPTFTEKKSRKTKTPISKWSSNRIKFLIEGDQVLGVLRETSKAKEKYEIKNYYPQVIDEKTVYEARELLHLKSNRGKKPKKESLINPFRGLINFEGTFLRFSHKIQCGKPCYYYGAFDLQNNKQIFFCKGLDLEHLIISATFVAMQEKVNIMTPEIDDKPFILLQRKKTELERRIENLVEAVASGSKSILNALQQAETDLQKVEADLKRITPITDFELPQNFEELFSVDHFKNQDREKIALAIRKVVQSIQIFKDHQNLLTFAKKLNPDFDKLQLSFVHYQLEIKREFSLTIQFKNGITRCLYNLPKENKINFIDIK